MFSHYSDMNEELVVVDWDSMFFNRVVGHYYSMFCSTLLRLVEDYVPVQEHRPPKWQLSPPQALMRRRAAA